MKKENVINILIAIEACFWRAFPMRDGFVDFYCQELACIPDEDVEAVIAKIKDMDDIPENIAKAIKDAHRAVKFKANMAKAAKEMSL